MATCEHRISNYDEFWDAQYCTICREWLEPTCSDPACQFCAERPDKAPVYW